MNTCITRIQPHLGKRLTGLFSFYKAYEGVIDVSSKPTSLHIKMGEDFVDGQKDHAYMEQIYGDITGGRWGFIDETCAYSFEESASESEKKVAMHDFQNFCIAVKGEIETVLQLK